MATRRSANKGKKRQRFLPFAFLRHGLEATVASLELDGAATADPIDPDLRVITLEDDDWQQAHLTVELNVPAELLAASSPPSSSAASSASGPNGPTPTCSPTRPVPSTPRPWTRRSTRD